jgi:ATP-dependent RNA helicase DDX55/SPB4
LEKGSTAFMSFVRAYKEHLCSFIFRLEFLDLGAVARSYGLLRLPKMAETRGVKGKPIVFETDAIDTSTIAYKHTEKEAARVRKLQQSLAAEAAAEEADDLGSVNSGDSNRGQIIPLSTRSVRSMRSTRSSRTGKTGKTGTKTVWVPSEQFERKDEKRERGKKKSATAKLREEWEDLAAEEGLFKKFKKGKLTKEKYDETLTSAERQAKEAWDEVDAENQRANGRKRRRGDDSDDSDFDGGDSGSEGGSDFDGDDMDSD